MHQIQFRLGLRPSYRPRWGSLQCSSDPLAGGEGARLRLLAPLPKNPTRSLPSILRPPVYYERPDLGVLE